MPVTVYVDILIFVNFYIDYLIIRLSIRFLKIKVKGFRVLLASFFASLTSLTFFLPENILIEIVSKFITAFILSTILYGFKRLFKLSATLLLLSATFNGIFLLLGKTFLSKRMITVNGSTYFDISLLTFGIASTVIYVILCLISRLFLSKCDSDFKVVVHINENIATFEGVSDSGNKLTDYLTGKYVIVCPENNISKECKTLRILPYTTLNSEGFVRIIKPNKVEIIYSDGTILEPDALIGINENYKSSSAIVNPALLI